MANDKSQMHLALFAIGTGHHVSGWRMPEAKAGALDFQFFRQIAEPSMRNLFFILHNEIPSEVKVVSLGVIQ